MPMVNSISSVYQINRLKEHSGGKTNFPTQVKKYPTRNVLRTCSPVPGKTHNRGPGCLMRSWVCGSANRLKILCVTQKQAFNNRSGKKGTTMVSKPNGLGRQP